MTVMARNEPDFQKLSFWRWFLIGNHGKLPWEASKLGVKTSNRLKRLLNGNSDKGGYRCVINGYLLIHAIVGLVLVLAVPVPLKDAANTVLFPLAGIFIGLSFAWVGNATALLQSAEIRSMVKHTDGGLLDYAYHYQVAILVLFTSLVLWGLAGLGIGAKWPNECHYAGKWLVYTMTSVALRECWQVVLSAQLLLICQDTIRDAKERHDKTGTTENS